MAIDHLWAPWRLEYIKGQRPGEKKDDKTCPFCELPKEEPNDQNLVLFKNDSLCIIMNRFPYNPGHLLVIPRMHEGNPSNINPQVWLDLSQALRSCIDILRTALKPQGFNVGLNLGAAGGAGIPEHLHWHVLPRWGGDTNFMPILAETKAIPAHNATVWSQLKPYFDDFAARLSADTIKI